MWEIYIGKWWWWLVVVFELNYIQHTPGYRQAVTTTKFEQWKHAKKKCKNNTQNIIEHDTTYG